MHLKPGTLLQSGKYRIVRFINSGGFGCTYEAVHTSLDDRFAIKEFFVKDFCNRDENTSYVTVGTNSKKALVEKLKNKFINEAKSIRKLHHNGIVKVSDVFEENGTAYYVMDYIEGRSLSQLIDNKGRLTETETMRYIRQVSETLKYVHSKNMLHLDIKPGNIMIDEEDNPILIDFGTSKQYDEESGENTSTLLGKTPGYAPLEQMDNSVQEFYPATDIYALGATMYKMLTGITPPNAIKRASGTKLEPLPSNISEGTRNAIETSLNILVENRPQSIDEFLRSLEFKKVTEDEGTDIETSKIKNEINGHEYVDLGLPSGIKWATSNVGASRPEEYGDYFAWGETREKSIYDLDNSVTYGKDFSDIKGDSRYDAARANWGGSWRLPKKEEIEELKDNCTWSWTTQGGKKGYKVTGLNGNSIFLPAAGSRFWSMLFYTGEYGGYWSSAPDESGTDKAYYLLFGSGRQDVNWSGRYYGRSIRPVSE